MNIKKAVFIATLATTGHFLASFMIQPLISLYATALGHSPMVIGFIIAGFGFLPMVLAIPAGAAMDRYDLRRVVRVGSWISIGAIFVLTGLGDMIVFLAFANIALGACHSILVLATQTYVAAVTTIKDRAANFAILGTGTAFGMAVAPAVGGAGAALALSYTGDEVLSYQIVFITGATLMIIPVVSGYLMPKSQSPENPKHDWSSLMTVVKRRGAQMVMLGTIVSASTMTLVVSFYPLLMVSMGHDSFAIGLALTVRSFSSLLIRPFVGVLNERFEPMQLMVGAMAISAVTWLALPLSPWLPYQYVNMALAGAGAGLLYPLLLIMTAGCCSEQDRGLGMGLRLAINRVFAVLAPAMLGIFTEVFGLQWSFAGMGIGLVAIVLFTIIFVRSHRAQMEFEQN